MKKMLFTIACATAALSLSASPARAQSVPPTVYVVVDAELNSVRAGRAAGGHSTSRVEDGTGLGLAGSRLGFRGTEDLGDGLTAGFVLEGGFLADTGTLAQGGRAFGRQTYVSLAHTSFGELRMGRQYLLGDLVSAIGEPFGGAMVTKTSTAISGVGFTSLPVWLDAARGDNIVQYATPVLGGFYAAVQAAPGEGTNDAFYALMGNYRGGSFTAAISHEWNKDRGTGAKTNRSWTFGGSYAPGPYKAGASFQHASNLSSTSGNGEAAGLNFTLPATASGPTFKATRFDGALASVEVPSGLFTFGAEWLQGRYRDSAGHSVTLKRPGLGATYALSKRTSLYAGFSAVVGDLKDYTNQRRIMNAGIRSFF